MVISQAGVRQSGKGARFGSGGAAKHRYLKCQTFQTCTVRRAVLQKHKQARPPPEREGLTAMEELSCCKITVQLLPPKTHRHCWGTIRSGVFFEFCSVG